MLRCPSLWKSTPKFFLLGTLLGLALGALRADTVTETFPSAIEIREQELIRRQELALRAKQAMAEGERLEEEGNLKEARAQYAFAVSHLGHASVMAPFLQRAKAHLIEVNWWLYADAEKRASLTEAFLLLKEILLVDPQNQKARQQLARLQSNIAHSPRKAVLGNPAITPAFVRKVKKVQILFHEAEALKKIGQYDAAREKLREILALDPTNETAPRELRKILTLMHLDAEQALKVTRAQRLEVVERNWSIPPLPQEFNDDLGEGIRPFTRDTTFALQQKLKTLILPELHFHEASIQDVASFFIQQSRQLDPEGEGINIIVKPEAIHEAKPLTLRLRHVPFEAALRYATQLAQVKYQIQEFAITFVPLKENNHVLLERTFHVPANFFSSALTLDREEEGGRRSGRRFRPLNEAIPLTSEAEDAKSLLEARGVLFPEGATAVYSRASGTLQMQNTLDQLELVEELLRAGTSPTHMVDVQVKIVEISQKDLNELTVNSAYNLPSFDTLGAPLLPFAVNVPVDALGIPTGKMAGATALRGSQGFQVNSINSLLGAGGSPIPNIFNISGTLNSQIFNFVISLLSQKKSFDLLSSPSLRVQSGEDANINVSRTFFFPTQFDPPQTAQIVQSNTINLDADVGPPTIIPAFPTEFESRDIGVKLTIKPQIGSDQKTIDLALFPEVTDFEGFVNYGTPIFVADSAGTPLLLTPNVINQPIFNTRRVSTRVFVEDGHTVVLGGLMRDEVQIIEDKVPFFGDLPLIGRLFQSKAEQSIKTNLLIFVTCRIFLNNGELLHPPPPPQLLLPSSSPKRMELDGKPF